MKKQLPPWLALCIIALAAGLLLSLTNALTSEPIAEANRQAANAARAKALPEAETFEAMTLPADTGLDSCHQGLLSGQTVGYAAQATVKGYGGDIEVIVGFDLTGAITGVSVGGSGFSETAGLGAKTRDEAFTGQFNGHTPPLTLKQDVDSVTGASISSGAVVSAVNLCADYVRTLEASAP